MAINIAKVFRMAAEIEVRRATDFLALYYNKYEAEVAALPGSALADPELAEFAADERFQLDELFFMAERSAVLALYQVVELNTVKILAWRWERDDITRKQLFKADKLKGELKSQLQLDVRALPGFAAVDELRLVNNAIKHQGVVTRELAKYAGWVVGAPLKNLVPFIERVGGEVPNYLEALAVGVVPAQRAPVAV